MFGSGDRDHRSFHLAHARGNLEEVSVGLATCLMQGIDRNIDTDWIKQSARQLGFSLVGITTPDPPHHLNVYRDWLASGHHAEMGYLEHQDARTKRANPRLLLSDCESIIVTGTSYSLGRTTDHVSTTEPRVAMYALGEDYHQVLVERSHRLVSQIENLVGRSIPHRIYTDTGPLLERELAQRSGLGWIGKNTCLIHPRQGSFFLLAEILLAFPLEPDAPFVEDYCGSCTRCIEACPMNCILPNRTIDASRCISYLTIEKKGSIPQDLRSELGAWVFGCDICQQVCPWNLRFAPPLSDPAFKPRPFLREATLSDFLKLSPQNWRTQLRGSPLERPRRKGLVRNAAVVAGNLADESCTDDLINVLTNDPEPVARAHAAWALGQMDQPQSQQALKSQLTLETNTQVRQEIAEALNQA
jgi:epoxyqueuosine reductase